MMTTVADVNPSVTLPETWWTMPSIIARAISCDELSVTAPDSAHQEKYRNKK